MVREVKWTPQAAEDLENIAEYISRDSQFYASSFVSQIYNSASSLNEFAERGRTVPELDDASIKEVFVKEYRIIYKVDKSIVTILTIIHGRRDFPL
jgi:toxin ParE1/3/4